MPERRDPIAKSNGTIAIAATVIADAAWLYPVFVILGMGFNRGAALLPLAVIILLLALAFGAGRLASYYVEDPTLRGPVEAIAGLGVIYLVISAIAPGDGLDLLWGPHMIGGAFSGRQTGGLIASMAAAGFLWHRGIRIAVETHPQLRLLQTFRTGLVALAVSVLVEQASGIDASATAMLILFFTAALGGLAFARLAPGGNWTPIVGLAVATVLGGGIAVGMLGAVIGGRGLGLLAVAWDYVAVGIMWLLRLLVWALVQILPDLSGRFGEDMVWDFRGFERPNFRNVDYVPSETGLTDHLLQYSALLLALYLAYRLLAWAYQAHARQGQTGPGADRESIRGEADATADLLNLLWSLLPAWLQPGAAPMGARFPQGRPGITEVYALYFDMLTAACGQGHEFVPSATPRERRSAVEDAIPGAPVARITSCFIAACYGNLATDPETVEQLRRELDGAMDQTA